MAVKTQAAERTDTHACLVEGHPTPTLFARAHDRAKTCFARYRSADDGAIAIEFAILAIPFFTILFAILELALIFFVNAAVDNAASAAARRVRVGSLQSQHVTADKQLTEFRKELCNRMPNAGNCQKNVRVVMKVTSGAFDPDLSSVKEPNSLDCSGPGDTVVMRISYKYPLAVSGKLTRLANDPTGANNHIITSTTAFRNEPFSTGPGSTCGNATQGDGGSAPAPTNPVPTSPGNPLTNTTPSPTP